MDPALQSPGYVFTPPSDGPLAIPEHAIRILPLPNASVRHIIGFSFPPITLETTSSINLRPSRKEPTELVLDALINQNIPCESALNKLKADLSKHHGGTRSIVYSITTEKSSTHQYYPVWVLTWWELVSIQIKKQKLWICADEWLASKFQTTDHPVARQMLSSAREFFSYLPWDVEIPRDKEYSTVDLAHYLSGHWLASRHIEWMLDRVKERLPTDESIILYPPSWIDQVAGRFEGKNAPASVVTRFLRKLQDSVARGDRPRVYTVANYDEVHWIALEIDFQKHSIAYGDSQGGSHSSRRFLNILKSWLDQTWPEEWNDLVAKELPHGDQRDATSCGICAVNTIEARIFGDRLWVQELSAAYRASKFLEVAYYMIEERGVYEDIPPEVYIEDVLNIHSTQPTSRRIRLSQLVFLGLFLIASYVLQNWILPCMPRILDELSCIVGYQRQTIPALLLASLFEHTKNLQEIGCNIKQWIMEALAKTNDFNLFH